MINGYIPEIWKWVDGYKKLYRISNKGQVYSYSSNKYKIPVITMNGYEYAHLWKDNKRKAKSIHRLVAKTFLPQIKGKNYINHIDGNKRNNDISNLEWCTFSENMKHGYDIGLYKARKGKDNSQSKPVVCFNGYELVKTFESVNDAIRHTGNKTISTVCKGKKDKAAGHRWMYKDQYEKGVLYEKRY